MACSSPSPTPCVPGPLSPGEGEPADGLWGPRAWGGEATLTMRCAYRDAACPWAAALCPCPTGTCPWPRPSSSSERRSPRPSWPCGGQGAAWGVHTGGVRALCSDRSGQSPAWRQPPRPEQGPPSRAAEALGACSRAETLVSRALEGDVPEKPLLAGCMLGRSLPSHRKG